MLSLVPVDPFKAIPTKPSVESAGCVAGATIFVSIVPAFFIVELVFPNIPVDFLACRLIVAPLLFVASEPITATPTAPSPFPVIVPLFVTSDLTVPLASPNIPVEFVPFRVIVAPLLFVAIEPFTAIPTAFSLFPVILPLFVIVDLVEFSFSPNIPVEFAPFRVIVAPLLFVAIEPFTAIPTAFSLFPVISPAFVIVELASPNIPVEYAVPRIIWPVVSFVAVEAFTAIPTIPSSVVVGVAVFVSIFPALLTVEPASPNIPVDFFAVKFIVAFLLFVALESLTAIPTAPSPLPLIVPLFVNVDLVEPTAKPNIPVEFAPLRVIVAPLLFVAVEAFAAIPTAFCLSPVILPAFVNVELASPYIPVEKSVPKLIVPVVSFVPVEAFKDIPTKPSSAFVGLTTVVSIFPALLTIESLFPIIPADLNADKVITPVVLEFVISDFSPNIAAEPCLVTLILALFSTTELVLVPVLFFA